MHGYPASSAPANYSPAARRRGRRVEPQVRLNARICQASDRSDVRELLELARTHHGEMNFVNLSTLMHRLARLAKRDTKIIQSVANNPQVALIRRMIERDLAAHAAQSPAAGAALEARCLATLSWSYATLRVREAASMRFVAELSKGRLSSFKGFELGNLLWGFAKLGLPEDGLLRAAAEHIPGCMHDFSAVGLSTVAWAFSTLGWPGRALLQTLGVAFVRRLDEASSHEIANMCWALATARVIDVRLFGALGDAAAEKLDTFNDQELTNTAWAISRGGVSHPALFDAIARLLESDANRAHCLLSQGLSNTLWAVAKQASAGADHGRMLHLAAMLLAPCHASLDNFKPQEMSSVLWACAQLRLKFGMRREADDLFGAVAAMLPARVAGLTPQGMTNVLYAFAEFSEFHMCQAYADFLARLSNLMLTRMNNFEMVGLLYVLESTKSLLDRDSVMAPTTSLRALADAAAARLVWHVDSASNAMLARLVDASAQLTPSAFRQIASAVVQQLDSRGRDRFQPHELQKLATMCGTYPMTAPASPTHPTVSFKAPQSRRTSGQRRSGATGSVENSPVGAAVDGGAAVQPKAKVRVVQTPKHALEHSAQEQPAGMPLSYTRPSKSGPRLSEGDLSSLARSSTRDTDTYDWGNSDGEGPATFGVDGGYNFEVPEYSSFRTDDSME